MKMLTLLIFIALFTLPAYSPIQQAMYIPEGKVIEPYEAIIKAVVAVESSGNPLAYNAKENAVGAFQIRQVRIDEYNRLSGEKLKLSDCYDYEISKRVFLFYSCRFRPDDYRLIARDWNKSKTEKYWKKVKANLNSEI